MPLQQEQIELLPLLDGAIIVWHHMSLSLQDCYFSATIASGARYDLLFNRTIYMDLPEQMNNVVIRLASAEETEVIREGLEETLPQYFRWLLSRIQGEVLAFTCTEGSYFLWVQKLTVITPEDMMKDKNFLQDLLDYTDFCERELVPDWLNLEHVWESPGV